MKLTLVNKIEEARGTKSFFWQPDTDVKYLPGQYLYYTISALKYPDPRGNTRHFTMASSPTEGNLIRLTTRVREDSGYKRTLDELPIGSVISGDGPNGLFYFDEKDTDPRVFIAGGIGITPFRSMIKFVADKSIMDPVFLIYSNTESDFVFKKELDELVLSHPNIKIRYVVSSAEGHLDSAKIASIVAEWKLEIPKLTWWLCGPPPMIDAMEKALGELKVTIDKVRSEKFTGY